MATWSNSKQPLIFAALPLQVETLCTECHNKKGINDLKIKNDKRNPKIISFR